MRFLKRKLKLYLSVRVILLLFITIFFCNITSSKLYAQDTTYKRHEWGIAYEPYFNANYFELHYKTFLKKKVYYNFHIGSLLNKHSTNLGKSTEFMFVPSAEFGVSLPFF